MKEENVIQKRKEIQEKIDKLFKKKRKLNKEFADDKFEDQKKQIQRYYINSYRQEYSGVYYYVMDEFVKGRQGKALVEARKLRLDSSHNYFGLNVAKTKISLRTLRNTEPIEKSIIKEKIIEPKKNIIKLVKDNFDIEL